MMETLFRLHTALPENPCLFIFKDLVGDLMDSLWCLKSILSIKLHEENIGKIINQTCDSVYIFNWNMRKER